MSSRETAQSDRPPAPAGTVPELLVELVPVAVIPEDRFRVPE